MNQELSLKDKTHWPFCLTLPILWGDMDAFNHANNVRYFRWFESARVNYFHELAADKYMTNQGVGPILAKADCNYHLPLSYPDTIDVKASTIHLGKTSIVQGYQIVSHKTEKVHATGEGIIVMVDYQKGEKVEIPQDFRKLIEAFESV